MTHLLTLHHNSPSQTDVELSERGWCLQTTNCLIWFNDKANSHNFEGRCSNISQSDSLIFCICLQIKTVILYKYFVYSKSRIKMLFLFPSINQHQIWFTLLITDIPQQKSSSPALVLPDIEHLSSELIIVTSCSCWTRLDQASLSAGSSDYLPGNDWDMWDYFRFLESLIVWLVISIVSCRYQESEQQ